MAQLPILHLDASVLGTALRVAAAYGQSWSKGQANGDSPADDCLRTRDTVSSPGRILIPSLAFCPQTGTQARASLPTNPVAGGSKKGNAGKGVVQVPKYSGGR